MDGWIGVWGGGGGCVGVGVCVCAQANKHTTKPNQTKPANQTHNEPKKNQPTNLGLYFHP